MVNNIGNDIKLHNIHFAQTGTTPVNFRANSTNTLERTPEKDTVETKKEEKKEVEQEIHITLLFFVSSIHDKLRCLSVYFFRIYDEYIIGAKHIPILIFI